MTGTVLLIVLFTGLTVFGSWAWHTAPHGQFRCPTCYTSYHVSRYRLGWHRHPPYCRQCGSTTNDYSWRVVRIGKAAAAADGPL